MYKAVDAKGAVQGLVNNAVDFFDMVGQTEWHKSLQRSLVHWIGIGMRHRVLDVGCGAGHFVIQLAQRAEYVVGVDALEDMVCRATLNLSDYLVDNGAIVLGRIQELPFGNGQFDVVTCLNLMFMFPDPAPYLTELMRVCKPGGQIVLMNPSTQLNPWSAQTYCAQHGIYDFERDSLLSWATAAARYRGPNDRTLEEAVKNFSSYQMETCDILHGLATLVRIEKPAGSPQENRADGQAANEWGPSEPVKLSETEIVE